MPRARATLIAFDPALHRDDARALLLEYLEWVAGVARTRYGLSFDVATMVASDLDDPVKFRPPSGRLHLVHCDGRFVGIGCLKTLAPGVGEIQRMYVQPATRGSGAGRLLLERLLDDARRMGLARIRLESLKALEAAHGLYRSAGFVETAPYDANSMRAYQPGDSLDTYAQSAVFMELDLDRTAQPDISDDRR